MKKVSQLLEIVTPTVKTMTQGKSLSHSSIAKKMSAKGFKKSSISAYVEMIAINPGYVYLEFDATEENIARADRNIPKNKRHYYIARDTKHGTIVRAWGFYNGQGVTR